MFFSISSTDFFWRDFGLLMRAGVLLTQVDCLLLHAVGLVTRVVGLLPVIILLTHARFHNY